MAQVNERDVSYLFHYVHSGFPYDPPAVISVGFSCPLDFMSERLVITWAAQDSSTRGTAETQPSELRALTVTCPVSSSLLGLCRQHIPHLKI